MSQLPFVVYRQPAETIAVEHLVEGSRFIATLGLASSVEDAKAFIQAVRAQMKNATHHVYAFRVGFGHSVIEGMSDDGEPSGTSGPPALAVLRGSNLGDVVVVITRYFGGTKLGKGGLVRAYTDATKLALENVPTKENIPQVCYDVLLEYGQYSLFKRTLVAHGATIRAEAFAETVSVTFEVAMPRAETLVAQLRNDFHGNIVIYPTTPA
jgi:uncharacterized YigZ family protein